MDSPSGPLSNHFSRGMWFRFTLAYAALFLPFSVATPYLQVLLRCRGYGRDQIGLIVGCFEAMAVLAPPLWGYVADRLHRPKCVLAISIVGAAPAFLLFGAVSGVIAGLAVAVLFGLFYRPLIPLTDGLTFRYINTHGGDYGSVRVGGSVGFICWIVMLEVLGMAKSTSGGMILIAMAVASVLQLASLALLPPDPGKPESHETAKGTHTAGLKLFTQRTFVIFTLCALLGRIAMMAYYGFFSLYLKEVHGFSKAGYIWFLGPLSEIPVIFFSRRIMDRIGVRNLFALGLLGCTVRLAGFGLAPSIWFVLPLQFLHSLTFGAYHTASVTYVSQLVPKTMQSTAQTIFAAITIGAGGLLGGAIGGAIAEHAGYTCLYLSFAGVALLALVLLLVFVPALGHGPGKGSSTPARSA